MTSSAFPRTFQHLVTANALLNDYPPLPPPLHPDPLPITPAGPTPPSPSETEIKIIQGRTQNSKVLLHAGFRYSRDGKLLVDSRQSWRCIKRNKCPGRLYTINGGEQQLVPGRNVQVLHSTLLPSSDHSCSAQQR